MEGIDEIADPIGGCCPCKDPAFVACAVLGEARQEADACELGIAIRGVDISFFGKARIALEDGLSGGEVEEEDAAVADIDQVSERAIGRDCAVASEGANEKRARSEVIEVVEGDLMEDGFATVGDVEAFFGGIVEDACGGSREGDALDLFAVIGLAFGEIDNSDGGEGGEEDEAEQAVALGDEQELFGAWPAGTLCFAATRKAQDLSVVDHSGAFFGIPDADIAVDAVEDVHAPLVGMDSDINGIAACSEVHDTGEAEVTGFEDERKANPIQIDGGKAVDIGVDNVH